MHKAWTKLALGSFARNWWPVVLIAALSGVVVLQRLQMRRPAPPPPPYRVGEMLPPFTLNTLDGRSARIEWTGRLPTMIYVLRPDCVWCSRNLASLRAVVGAASGYRIVGVSLRSAGLKQYVKETGLPFPIYVVPDANTVQSLRLNVTPETIIVARTGVVVKVFQG
jgi:hypothetical protein